MTNPQYRVIADKDSTPDLVSANAAPGDRLVYDVIDADRWSLVRIERPVEVAEPAVQPPTREQITTAVRPVTGRWYDTGGNLQERLADAVLALFPQPTPSVSLDLAEQTAITRSIDDEFMQEGGTTRHWVQALNRAGYVIALAAQPLTDAPPSIADMAPGTTGVQHG